MRSKIPLNYRIFLFCRDMAFYCTTPVDASYEGEKFVR